MIQVVMDLGSVLASACAKAWAVALSLPLVGAVLQRLQNAIPDTDDQNILSFFVLLARYRSTDFTAFMRTHREALRRGQETGDFVPGVCNYYRLMADIITLCSGPFWHFVPMTEGSSRKECHDQFHHRMAGFLAAKSEDKVLEFGCGFGEIGRQVALISGASVTGLTMADEEIAGGNERIKRAGLEGRCAMVQGNYHKMPFESETFDKVFGVYTLKYSADLTTAIGEMARVLKPGGRFVSYEILVSDAFDASNKQHRYYVDNISHSTCMPPLWPAQAVRDAAEKAGLVAKEEVDLCSAPKEGAWYSCFERTGIHALLSSSALIRLVRLAEAVRILPRSFTDFFEACLVHPTTDFVNAGRLGIVTGSVMMVWEKPC
jgi:ubiquinone/menaquinone biosynthesis C-methylase UbiE